jgi:adenylate kinase family enzyme
MNKLKKEYSFDMLRVIAMIMVICIHVSNIYCRSYNLLDNSLKPLVDNICNKCGYELSVRSDDNEVTFNKGFNLYLEETLPLVHYYEQRGILRKIKIESTDTVQDIFNKIKSIIG